MSDLFKHLLIYSLKQFWNGQKSINLNDESDLIKLLKIATRQKMVWQLNKVLKRSSKIDDEIKNAFLAENRKVLKRNLYFASEMETLKLLAEKASVEILFYKGVALSVDIYGNAGARPCNDIDVLVNGAKEAERLRKILIAKGYQWIDNLPARQNRHFLKYHCEYMLIEPKRNILVEIHWKLFHRYLNCEFDVNKVFDASRNILICGKTFRTLGLVDYLITLSIHHTKHNWLELRHVSDMAGLVKKIQDEDWAIVIERAKEMGVLRAFFVALALADISGIYVPEWVKGRMKSDRHVGIISNYYKKQLIESDCTQIDYLSEMKLLIHIRERWSDRIRFAIGGLLSPSMNDYKYVDLPESLFFLYYLVRPFRQLIKILGIL